MAYVRTTDGVWVDGISDKGPAGGTLTLDEAQASVKDRNERAKDLGVATRYEAGE